MRRNVWTSRAAAVVVTGLLVPVVTADDLGSGRVESVLGAPVVSARLDARTVAPAAVERVAVLGAPVTLARPDADVEYESQGNAPSPDQAPDPVARVLGKGGFGGGPTGGGPGGMGGGPGGGPPGYDVSWYPSRAVRGQNTDLGFVRQGLVIGAPVWQSGENKLIATLGVRHTYFSTDAILPDTGRAFPEQLWNLNFGLNYKHKFENGWTGMLTIGFGSASDKPFHSLNVMTANLFGLVRIPAANDRDNWQVGLMYKAGGQINFPIPVLAYGWNPSDRLRVNIGLPFSAHWQPADDWTVSVSYMPLLNINAKVNYQFAPRVQLYGGYENLTEQYLLADRANNRDRFFGVEQRLVTGLRWDVWERGTLDVNGGYSFGRYYGEGESQDNVRDRVNVDPGLFLGGNFRLRF